ncbi:unnamed protein product [Vitrella brassicaformis CCMP3155]|uniref:Uncharacterized protein n=4 Tax=Vitrella brassicaformis TaxID=1169539 RepID=A0A0G4EAV0_VITBC|nr:unnamed protein product [Vitrella brassicaformis CCMP3155]|eukprot:CEL92428.1 unnamed protein product [Vitrella brassicaformis CCMP3155]
MSEAFLGKLEEWLKSPAHQPLLIDPSAHPAPPALVSLSDTTLHDYQQTGLGWMIAHYQVRQTGVILADQMGLGKTLQTLSFLAWLLEHGHTHGPFLVICPTTVVATWQQQAAQHVPSVGCQVYSGTASEREAKRKAIVNKILSQPRARQCDPALPFEVLITSDTLARQDASFLSKFRWRAVVVDEAHCLKNPQGKLYKTLLHDYNYGMCLMLTGTPIQNKMQELWSLLHFLDRKRFADCDAFVSTFTSLSSRARGVLQDIMRTYMLRRTMNDVKWKLPPKKEYVLEAPLTPLQRQQYKWLLTKDSSVLMALADKNNTGQSSSSSNARAAAAIATNKGLNNLVQQLRKCVSHPYLFDGVEPEPFVEGDHIWQTSGKLMLLEKLLPKLKSEGSRVLLFSGFTRMLDIVQDYLSYRRLTFERLDGSIRGEDRADAIQRFKQGDRTTAFAFLLSTRAGGQGVNLEVADVVIFLDSDWNPQADKQALARVYRQGQKRSVRIFRFLTPQTIEEVIFKRARKKLQLAADILGKDKDAHDEQQDGTGAPGGGKRAGELRAVAIWGLRHWAGQQDDTHGDESSVVSEWMKARIEDILEQAQEMTDEEEEQQQQQKNQQQQGESVYQFEGADYKDAYRRAQTEEREDLTALETLMAAKAAEDKENEDLGVAGRLRRPLISEEEREEMDHQEQARKEQRKLDKWRKKNYTSLSITLEAVPEGEQPSTEEDLITDQGEDEEMMGMDQDGGGGGGDAALEADYLHFVRGNAAKPTERMPAIVLHVLDNSGSWNNRGFGRALNELSEELGPHYELAKEMGDLRVGDVHLLDVDGDIHVALAICQKYSESSGTRSPIDLSAFRTGLLKVAQAARPLGASVHLPRIGTSTDGQPDQWYAVERCLRRYLAQRKVHTHVYYFQRQQQQQQQAANPRKRPLPTNGDSDHDGNGDGDESGGQRAAAAKREKKGDGGVGRVGGASAMEEEEGDAVATAAAPPPPPPAAAAAAAASAPMDIVTSNDEPAPAAAAAAAAASDEDNASDATEVIPSPSQNPEPSPNDEPSPAQRQEQQPQPQQKKKKNAANNNTSSSMEDDILFDQDAAIEDERRHKEDMQKAISSGGGNNNSSNGGDGESRQMSMDYFLGRGGNKFVRGGGGGGGGRGVRGARGRGRGGRGRGGRRSPDPDPMCFLGKQLWVHPDNLDAWGRWATKMVDDRGGSVQVFPADFEGVVESTDPKQPPDFIVLSIKDILPWEDFVYSEPSPSAGDLRYQAMELAATITRDPFMERVINHFKVPDTVFLTWPFDYESMSALNPDGIDPPFPTPSESGATHTISVVFTDWLEACIDMDHILPHAQQTYHWFGYVMMDEDVPEREDDREGQPLPISALLAARIRSDGG